MANIGLVSCAASKRQQAAPAGELYTSVLFQKAREYVCSNCDRWFILSAKHGLLRPDEIVEPYDLTLSTMSKADRQTWAEGVFGQLLPLMNAGDQLTVLAGKRYREFLLTCLEHEGFSLTIPLAGMRIGEQLQWLKNQSR